MTTCTRKLLFCAGHRVVGHENKCAHLHGHNYVVYVTAHAPELDRLGRVVDFSVIKAEVGAWLDADWDHGFLLWENDGPAIEAMRRFSNVQKLALLPLNPTAENLARMIADKGNQLLRDAYGVEITHVRVWETPNCYADFNA